MQLDQASLEKPDPETKTLIRCFARKAKDSKRLDVVQYLREITPAGTTVESAKLVCFVSVQLHVHYCLRSILEQPIPPLPATVSRVLSRNNVVPMKTFFTYLKVLCYLNDLMCEVFLFPSGEISQST